MDCTLYVDTERDPDWISRRIISIFSGQQRYRTLRTDLFEVDIERNDEVDSRRAKDKDEGFLFYPIVLSFESHPGVTPEAFIDALQKIVSDLRLAGARVTAACDFEDMLR